MLGNLKKNKLSVAVLFAVILALLLTGCSTKEIKSSLGFSGEVKADSPEALAMKGMDYYNQGKYGKALKAFEAVMNRYPFSDYSLLAELKSADSNYYLENYEEALLLYKDFEENHPTNEAIPYVMYQMGMSHYTQIDTIDRDMSGAINSIYAFTRLLRAYPNSPYTNEAEARIRAARNFLANHEFYVVRFYVRTKAYSEAEGRLEYILRQYPETEVTPKAEKMLADLKAGNPPKRSLFGFLPSLSLPDWQLFSDADEEKQTDE
jgi:outer membrane protein assembly factor BamD